MKIRQKPKKQEAEIVKALCSLLAEAVKKSISKEKIGVLFSGGVDSSVLAFILKNLGKPPVLYTTALIHPSFKEPDDLAAAKKASKWLNLPLKVIKIKLADVEEQIKQITNIICDTSPVKVGVALTSFKALEQAKKDGCRIIFSGLGSEEIFAGYQRHKDSKDINKECLAGLEAIYERDISRDSALASYYGVEIKTPFLDTELVEYSLKIPAEYKIKDGVGKYILRKAAKSLGLPDFIAQRKKRAAQYGSNTHKALEKLAKQHGYNHLSGYMSSFAPKLGALVSTGKDSIFAMYKMIKRGFPVECMITLKSSNPDSYMFHTPAVELAKLQAEAIGLPLVEKKTKGEKEAELADLKRAISEAIKKHGIQGIITGALFSNYQKERIEKVCSELSLKQFSPLWHMGQEEHMRSIIKEGFKFIITKVAAEGLDKSWLNRIITENDIEKLVELNKKVGINIAGEGGEYETLMVDGPIFRKRIKIANADMSGLSVAHHGLQPMDKALNPEHAQDTPRALARACLDIKEDKYSAVLNIRKAVLDKKAADS